MILTAWCPLYATAGSAQKLLSFIIWDNVPSSTAAFRATLAPLEAGQWRTVCSKVSSLTRHTVQIREWPKAKQWRYCLVTVCPIQALAVMVPISAHPNKRQDRLVPSGGWKDVSLLCPHSSCLSILSLLPHWHLSCTLLVKTEVAVLGPCMPLP